MKETKRARQVADQIKNEIGWLLDHKVKDHDKGFVTITAVKLTPDLRLATIYYSVLGEPLEKQNSTKALQRAIPFLRNELKSALRLRFLPELRFFYDDSLEYSDKINRLIQKIHEQDSNQ